MISGEAAGIMRQATGLILPESSSQLPAAFSIKELKN